MKAPMCPICGEAHWGLGQCPKFDTESKAERIKKAVEAVANVSVAKSETPVAKSKKGGRRQGAGRKPVGVKAMTPAERMRKTRANRSANKSV